MSLYQINGDAGTIGCASSLFSLNSFFVGQQQSRNKHYYHVSLVIYRRPWIYCQNIYPLRKWTEIVFVTKANFSATGTEDHSGRIYNRITEVCREEKGPFKRCRSGSHWASLRLKSNGVSICTKLAHMVWIASEVQLFFLDGLDFWTKYRTVWWAVKDEPINTGRRRHQMFNWQLVQWL